MNDVAQTSEANFFWRHRVRILISVLVTASVIWGATHFGIDLVPSAADIERVHVRWWTLPVSAIAICLMTYFRAVRWRFLLREVGYVPIRKLLLVSLVGFAAITLLPVRLGEFVRPAMLRTKGKISFSAATGSVIGERVVDGFYLSVILAIAIVLLPTIEPLPKYIVGLEKLGVTPLQVRGYAFLMLGIFTGALATITVYFFARSFAHRATLAVFGIVSKKLGERLAHEAERVADGLHFLKSPKDARGFLFESTLYWGLNAGAMWLLAWGCHIVHADGSGPTYLEGLAIMGMLGIAVLIPGPPALIGVFQIGINCGLSLYFPASIVAQNGKVYAFLLFALQIFIAAVAGLVALRLSHTSLREMSDEEAAATENLAQGVKTT